MNKQQSVPQTDENRYLNTTHKCNLTGAELSTILYCLEGYIQGNDDYNSDMDCYTKLTSEQQDWLSCFITVWDTIQEVN